MAVRPGQQGRSAASRRPVGGHDRQRYDGDVGRRRLRSSVVIPARHLCRGRRWSAARSDAAAGPFESAGILGPWQQQQLRATAVSGLDFCMRTHHVCFSAAQDATSTFISVRSPICPLASRWPCIYLIVQCLKCLPSYLPVPWSLTQTIAPCRNVLFLAIMNVRILAVFSVLLRSRAEKIDPNNGEAAPSRPSWAREAPRRPKPRWSGRCR